MFASLGRHKFTIGLVVFILVAVVAIYAGFKGYYNGVTLEAMTSARGYYNGTTATLNDKFTEVVTSHDRLADRVTSLEGLAKQFDTEKSAFDARVSDLEAKVSALEAKVNPPPVSYRKR